MSEGEQDAVTLPIDGTLDLHTFQPAEVADLVKTYLDECLQAGIYQVRIIHGKGKGVLRRIVHAQLDHHPAVRGYKHDPAAGSWGATVVTLKASFQRKEGGNEE